MSWRASCCARLAFWCSVTPWRGFTIEAYRKAVWQLQIALALGFFALLVGLTHYASPGAVGAFALGAGVTFLREYTSRSEGQDS